MKWCRHSAWLLFKAPRLGLAHQLCSLCKTLPLPWAAFRSRSTEVFRFLTLVLVPVLLQISWDYRHQDAAHVIPARNKWKVHRCLPSGQLSATLTMF